MAEHPVDVDLPAHGRALGVSFAGERVAHDDRAPLAAIRRAMVSIETGNRSPLPR
jgi:hypothetical protein